MALVETGNHRDPVPSPLGDEHCGVFLQHGPLYQYSIPSSVHPLLQTAGPVTLSRETSLLGLLELPALWKVSSKVPKRLAPFMEVIAKDCAKMQSPGPWLSDRQE